MVPKLGKHKQLSLTGKSKFLTSSTTCTNIANMGTFLSASADPSSLFGRGGIDPAGGNVISSSISWSAGFGMGNLPTAISTKETPKLQISDSTEYFVPESLSGYIEDRHFYIFLTLSYRHVRSSTNKRISSGINQFPANAKITQFDFS